VANLLKARCAESGPATQHGTLIVRTCIDRHSKLEQSAKLRKVSAEDSKRLIERLLQLWASGNQDSEVEELENKLSVTNDQLTWEDDATEDLSELLIRIGGIKVCPF
jgi:hypothetical protein